MDERTVRVELTQFLDVFDEGVVLLRADRVLAANGWASRLLGWECEELEGRSFLDVVHPDERTESLLSNEVPRTWLVRGDGTSMAASLSPRRLEVSGETLVCLFVRQIRDQAHSR